MVASTLGNIVGEQRSISCNECKPNDMLLVIDMQNDFCLPPPGREAEDKSHPKEGNFYVAEGNQTIEGIASLISGFPGRVVASVDYHPPGHCSFLPAQLANCADQHMIGEKHCCLKSGQNCSGPFPPHCVWETEGAKLHRDIKTALDDEGVRDRVVYIHKGFHHDHDSFGAAQYHACREPDDIGAGCNYQCGRIIGKSDTEEEGNIGCDSFNSSHTGAYLLNDTEVGKGHGGHNELINATQMMDYQQGRGNMRSFNDYLTKYLSKIGDIYVVGLAGDFCVLDTVRNLKQAFPDKEVYFVLNHTRFAWLPSYIPYSENNVKSYPAPEIEGGRFLTHPQYVYNMVKGVGAKFCTLL